MDRNLSEFRLTALTGRKEKGMDGGSHFSAHVAQFQSKFCIVLSCFVMLGKTSVCVKVLTAKPPTHLETK